MDVLFVQYNLRRNLYMKSTKRVLALGMAYMHDMYISDEERANEGSLFSS